MKLEIKVEDAQSPDRLAEYVAGELLSHLPDVSWADKHAYLTGIAFILLRAGMTEQARRTGSLLLDMYGEAF